MNRSNLDRSSPASDSDLRFRASRVGFGDGADATFLLGVAAPFATPTIYQGQKEQIMPTAFDASLADPNHDVQMYLDHRYTTDSLLATRLSSTLSLEVTPNGLRYEATLPQPLTDKTKHVASLAKQGVLGASIGGRIVKDKFVDGVRNIEEFDLREISITPMPAYKSTTVQQRDEVLDAWLASFQTEQDIVRRRYAAS